jgi:phage terminase large subunit-like protein
LLESQMAGFNPESSLTSPDRVDALVWGMSALLLSGATPFVV